MANPAKSHIPYMHSQTNEVRWKEVDPSVNCNNRPLVTASEWANLPTTQPGAVTGYNFKRKLVCVVSSGDIVVTSDPADFTPDGTTPPVDNADQFIITGIFSTP